MAEIQKQELTSMNIAEEQLRKLKQLFPEAFTEGLKVDWDKLRLTLGEAIAVPLSVSLKLAEQIRTHRLSTFDEIGQRNAVYFESELEKLDHWGEDRRNSLKVTLKDLDMEIKEVKKQSRLAPNLPDKLKLEKQRKKLENERDTAWKEYDGAAKEIEQNKDKLIDQIEQRLQQNLNEEPLFLIKWNLI